VLDPDGDLSEQYSPMQIYIDGEWHSRETAKVSVFDHGLLYGDGVFEGIRAYSRRIFRLDAHLDRLYDSAQALALTVPLARKEMAAAVEETVRRNQRDDVYVRLIVTRGVGELGIDPLSCPKPSVIVIANDVRVYPRELYAGGIKVMTSATRQVSHEAVDPRIKSLNYLKNILAKIDAQQAGAHEAIMLNAEGFIAECTADNLFVVRGGQLLTPAPQDGALGGITRGVVLELAGEARIPAAEARLTRYDLYTAEEAFVTGTGAELMPVTTADGRALGDGTPGPITRRLTEAFHALVHNEGRPLW
jgi:branched-chain amino acid aminotransferase